MLMAVANDGKVLRVQENNNKHDLMDKMKEDDLSPSWDYTIYKVKAEIIEPYD